MAKEDDLRNIYGDKINNNSYDDLGVKETKRTAQDSPGYKRQQEQKAKDAAEAKREAARQRAAGVGKEYHGGNVKGTIAVGPDGTARDLGKWSQRTFQEDLDIIKRSTKKEVEEALKSLRSGVANSKLAQSIASIGRSDAGRNALKALKVGGPIVAVSLAAFDTVMAAKNTAENWDAPGSDWRSRAADVQATLSAPLWTAGGSTIPVAGGLAGATFGTYNTIRKQDEARNIREQNIARQQAEDELREMNIDPNASYTDILTRKSTPPGYVQVPVRDDVPVVDTTPDEETLKLAQRYDERMARMQQPQQATDVANTTAQNDTPIPSGANDQVLAQAIGYNPTKFDYTNLNSVGNYGLQAGTPEGMARAAYDQTLEGQLANQVVNPQGQITPQDMMAQLNNYYNKVNQLIQEDPRYSGQMVQPSNQYNVDMDALARAQRGAQVYQAMTDYSKMPELLQQQAVQNYQQQLANQAGVPYEDYINAMTERRKLGILSQQEQIENALKVQAAQATDMKSKLGYLQEMEKLRQETARALQKADIEGQYKLAEAGLTGEYGNRRELISQQGQNFRQQQQLQDPYRQFKDLSTGIESLSYGLGGPQGIGNYALGLPEEARTVFSLSPDYRVTNDVINQMFPGSNTYVPQMNNIQNAQQGGQGVLPWLSNVIRGNKQ